jgi:hypothetical protein
VRHLVQVVHGLAHAHEDDVAGRPLRRRFRPGHGVLQHDLSGGEVAREPEVAVAQNRQCRVHPAWLETQTVVRSSAGMSTVSTVAAPSASATFVVPSGACCRWSGATRAAGRLARTASQARRVTPAIRAGSTSGSGRVS